VEFRRKKKDPNRKVKCGEEKAGKLDRVISEMPVGQNAYYNWIAYPYSYYRLFNSIAMALVFPVYRPCTFKNYKR